MTSTTTIASYFHSRTTLVPLLGVMLRVFVYITMFPCVVDQRQRQGDETEYKSTNIRVLYCACVRVFFSYVAAF